MASQKPTDLGSFGIGRVEAVALAVVEAAAVWVWVGVVAAVAPAADQRASSARP